MYLGFTRDFPISATCRRQGEEVKESPCGGEIREVQEEGRGGLAVPAVSALGVSRGHRASEERGALRSVCQAVLVEGRD